MNCSDPFFTRQLRCERGREHRLAKIAKFFSSCLPPMIKLFIHSSHPFILIKIGPRSKHSSRTFWHVWVKPTQYLYFVWFKYTVGPHTPKKCLFIHSNQNWKTSAFLVITKRRHYITFLKITSHTNRFNWIVLFLLIKDCKAGWSKETVANKLFMTNLEMTKTGMTYFFFGKLTLIFDILMSQKKSGEKMSLFIFLSEIIDLSYDHPVETFIVRENAWKYYSENITKSKPSLISPKLFKTDLKFKDCGGSKEGGSHGHSEAPHKNNEVPWNEQIYQIA